MRANQLTRLRTLSFTLLIFRAWSIVLPSSLLLSWVWLKHLCIFRPGLDPRPWSIVHSWWTWNRFELGELHQQTSRQSYLSRLDLIRHGHECSSKECYHDHSRSPVSLPEICISNPSFPTSYTHSIRLWQQFNSQPRHDHVVIFAFCNLDWGWEYTAKSKSQIARYPSSRSTSNRTYKPHPTCDEYLALGMRPPPKTVQTAVPRNKKHRSWIVANPLSSSNLWIAIWRAAGDKALVLLVRC